MKKVKKTATKKEKKQVHKIVKNLELPDFNIVMHVVEMPPQEFDWFGEIHILDKIFLNKYGMCIGCICFCRGCGTIRVMDPSLYDEFINNGGEGW